MSERWLVLLVEDNPADADLTRETLGNSPRGIDLEVAVSGTEAVDYVQRRGRFATSPRPDLVLLDLNLPGVDGKEVLKEIKQHAETSKVPVTVLTSSTSDKDVIQSYALGANCYIVKPLDFKNFEVAIQAVEEFWFSVVRLPPTNEERER